MNRSIQSVAEDGFSHKTEAFSRNMPLVKLDKVFHQVKQLFNFFPASPRTEKYFFLFHNFEN